MWKTRICSTNVLQAVSSLFVLTKSSGICGRPIPLRSMDVTAWASRPSAHGPWPPFNPTIVDVPGGFASASGCVSAVGELVKPVGHRFRARMTTGTDGLSACFGWGFDRRAQIEAGHMDDPFLGSLGQLPAQGADDGEGRHRAFPDRQDGCQRGDGKEDGWNDTHHELAFF